MAAYTAAILTISDKGFRGERFPQPLVHGGRGLLRRRGGTVRRAGGEQHADSVADGIPDEGELSPGDDIMYVLVGGDIRPRVIDALQFLVGSVR
mgnify:CR=1 FL=1